MDDGYRSAVHGFLRSAVLSRAEVDRFLAPDGPKWAQFDAELGYLPHSSRVPDGVNDAISTYRYGPDGERLMINYAGSACRVNTYGDSFTQGHQVSDGETWQEALAAHIGEPVRNFGVGGHGLYQACLRLERVEFSVGPGAPYVILNIFEDDHYRNLDAYRLLRLGRGWRDYDLSLKTSMFHSNPWRHVGLAPATGALVHLPNLCPTSESLYLLCDSDFVVNEFEDDLVTNVLVARQTGICTFFCSQEQLAGTLGVPWAPGAGRAVPVSAVEELYRAMALQSSLLVLDELGKKLTERGKSLLIVLSYGAGTIEKVAAGAPRPDQAFVDALGKAPTPVVDLLQFHLGDWGSLGARLEPYLEQLFQGHYTPRGNALCASAILGDVVRWLEPCPPAYRRRDELFGQSVGPGRGAGPAWR